MQGYIVHKVSFRCALSIKISTKKTTFMDSIYNTKYYDIVALSIPGYKEVVDKIIQLVDKKSYCSILDVGTGTGRIALKLADKVFKIVAIDISQEMLNKLDEETRKKHIDNIQTVRRNITDWSFLWPVSDPILLGCAFNSVICSLVLHHINTRWKKVVLEELKGSLKSDGLLVILGVNAKSAWKVKKLANRLYWDLIKKKENKYPIRFILKRTISYLFFEHRLSKERWRGLLNGIGYDNVNFETFGNFELIWTKR